MLGQVTEAADLAPQTSLADRDVRVNAGTIVLNGIPVVVTLTQNRGWGELELASTRGSRVHARVVSLSLRHFETSDIDNATGRAQLGSQVKDGGELPVGAVEDGTECLRPAVDIATTTATRERVLDSGGIEKPEQRIAPACRGEFATDRPNGVNVDLAGQQGRTDDQPPVRADTNFGVGRHENGVEFGRCGQVPITHDASPSVVGCGDHNVGDGRGSGAELAALESDATGSQAANLRADAVLAHVPALGRARALVDHHSAIADEFVSQVAAAELLAADAVQAATSPVGPRNTPAHAVRVDYQPDGRIRLVRSGVVWTVEEEVAPGTFQQRGGHYQSCGAAASFIDTILETRR